MTIAEAGQIQLGRQRSPKNHRGPHMIPYLRVANVHENEIRVDDLLEMNFTPAEQDTFRLEPGDVLLNEGQSYELVGRPALYRGEVPGACFQNTLLRFRANPDLLPEFALVVFRCYLRNGRFRRHAQQTTNIAHLSAGRLKTIEFPLPPLPEQKRIVEKVDQLMALCDELEARQKQKREKAVSLNTAALSAVVHAPNNSKLKSSWSRVQDHFEVLYELPENVKELRQTILQLAVMGKLTPSQGRRPTEPGQPEEPLPSEWSWTRLGDVAELINGDRGKNYPNRSEYVTTGVPWINTGHIEPDGTLSLDRMNYIERAKFDSLRSGKIKPGDLVYCLRGATMGKTAIITQFDEGAVASSLVILRLDQRLCSRFAYFFLTSPVGRREILKFDNGSAQPNLSAASVKKYWIPLAPPEDQMNVVSKCDQLLTICDHLEAKLAQHRDRGQRLIAAVVESLVA